MKENVIKLEKGENGKRYFHKEDNKKYLYFCLCGNKVFARRNNLRIECAVGHGGNVAMLCENQWSKKA